MRQHDPTIHFNPRSPHGERPAAGTVHNSEDFLKVIARNLSRAKNTEAAVTAFGKELKIISDDVGDDLQSDLLPIGKSI